MAEKKSDYFSADWEALEVECEDCEHVEHYVSDDEDRFYECGNCKSTNVVPTWNYEDMKCLKCSKNIEIEESIYAKEDGEFEEVICEACFNNLEE